MTIALHCVNAVAMAEPPDNIKNVHVVHALKVRCSMFPNW